MQTKGLIIALLLCTTLSGCLPEPEKTGSENIDDESGETTDTGDKNSPFYLRQSTRNVHLHPVFSETISPQTADDWRYFMRLLNGSDLFYWEAWISDGIYIPYISSIETHYNDYETHAPFDHYHDEADCATYGSATYSATKTTESNLNSVTYRFESVYDRCVNYDESSVRDGSFLFVVEFLLDTDDIVTQTDWTVVSTGIADEISDVPMDADYLEDGLYSVAQDYSMTLTGSRTTGSGEIEIDIDLSGTFHSISYVDSKWYHLTADAVLDLVSPIVYESSEGLPGIDFTYNIEAGTHVLQNNVFNGHSTYTFDGEAL